MEKNNIFCQKCGHQNTSNDKTCTNCNENLSKVVAISVFENFNYDNFVIKCLDVLSLVSLATSIISIIAFVFKAFSDNYFSNDIGLIVSTIAFFTIFLIFKSLHIAIKKLSKLEKND